MCYYDEISRKVTLHSPDVCPPQEPYYYSLQDWSRIGCMSKLKKLSIQQICVEDFSFLCKCQSVEYLSLYHTNFSDCHLLLAMPNLKSVDLRLCPLQHIEILDFASFQYKR